MTPQAHRQILLAKLNRDWPALYGKLRNGRKLNRLSTKQLQRKVAACKRLESAQRAKYVGWLESVERQGHLKHFLAYKHVSLLQKFNLVGA